MLLTVVEQLRKKLMKYLEKLSDKESSRDITKLEMNHRTVLNRLKKLATQLIFWVPDKFMRESPLNHFDL